ncbi:kinase-like protein [Rhizopogon salebrosus TDB-379]|nr:kinase-like protein [Rhizopogon salebrosus TDB-379]
MDRTVRVWRADNGEELLQIKAHRDWVQSVAWFPDGQQLVSASDDEEINFWDAHTGREVGRPCKGHTDAICSLAISSDGSFIATASFDKTVRLWSTTTRQQIGQALVHSKWVQCVAISPDSTLLASCTSGKDDHNFYLWSSEDILEPYNALEKRKEWIEAEKLGDIAGAGTPQLSDSPRQNTLPILPSELSHDFRNLNLNASPPSRDDTSVLGTVNPARPRSETNKSNDEIGGEGEESDEDQFFDVPATPTETSKESIHRKGDKQEDSDEDVAFVDASSSVAHLSSPTSVVQIVASAALPSHHQRQERHDVPPPLLQVQAELDVSVLLQDLTKYITKVEDYAVARGGFGEIWRCTYSTDQGPVTVAVKSLLMYASDQLSEVMEKKTKRIQRELRTCARLKHPNILSVYGYTFGFGPFMAIVSPWAENGNLTAYMEHADTATLTVVRRFQILRDITAGLKYLHDNNVIHGDLTGPNVLIHADGTACLADFGLSLLYSEVISISQASWTSSFHGNFRWLAPELLGQSDNDMPVRPRKHSDVYSFGGVMLQVLTNQSPYYYLSEAAVIRCIYTGEKPNRSRYSALSGKYWDFIEKCWSAATDDRPSTDKVVQVISDEFDSLSSSASGS